MATARRFWSVAGLAAVLAIGAIDMASALPVGSEPVYEEAPSASPIETAAMVCGPRGCFGRPLWRYGPGIGFRPFRNFGFVPARRFGFRPFGFGRFGGRRW